MDHEIKNEADNSGEVTTLRDYLGIVACLFGAFFLSMMAVLIACGVAQVVVDTFSCLLNAECDMSDIVEYVETQTFIFTLHGIGVGFVASFMSLPLCVAGGFISLRFRLHPSLNRNLYTAAGLICGALYGALLYITKIDRVENYKLWICVLAVPVSGALACWAIYPMLRRARIPNVFMDE